LGTLLVVVLFAALIVPRFIDWSNYTAAFETRAEQILGHPVKVSGTAEASILPTPSLSFTNVTVGASADAPMATVERFEATIELMPLLQGEIRVTSMRMVAPRINIRSDNRGLIDWFQRGPSSEQFDPDRVILESVQIEDGALTFVDDRFGVTHTLEDIRALVSARSLAGPWRADDASLSVNGQHYQFNLATGRVLSNGALRIKVDIQPRRLPLDMTVDGKLRSDAIRGLVYNGTYNARMIGTAPDGTLDLAGWRSEGSFNAVLGGVDIDRAVVSHGPPDRPLTLAGSLKIRLGDTPRFSAAVQANQIDLDRTLGAGPSEPIDIPTAVERLLTLVRTSPKPPIKGDVIVDVPVIVAGGAIIQGFRLEAEIGPSGMTVSNLIAELPGRATATLGGTVRTDDRMGFKGQVGLSVLQPATFAGWWRGKSASVENTARLLSNFEVAGNADIRPGFVKLDQLRARVGSSEITGKFNWSAPKADRRRILSGQLTADRFDVVQLRSLGELLVGQSFDGVDALADDYIFNISAKEVAFEDVIIENIAIDASYTRDGLRVNQFSIGDPLGDSFTTFSGQLVDLAEANPTGTLQGHIKQVSEVNFLIWAANRFFPDSPLAKWLTKVGPSLAPAVLDVSIEPVAERRGAIRLKLIGVAGPTTLNVTVEGAASSQRWRDEPVNFDLVFDSADSQSLLRQAGTGLNLPADHGVAHVEIRGEGVPSTGITTNVKVEIGGVGATAEGALMLDADGAMSFTGKVTDGSGNMDDVAALMGFAPADVGRTITDLIDGADSQGQQRIVVPAADITADENHVALNWQNALVGARRVSGELAWSKKPDLGWRMSGDLATSALDLDWLMALGLGAALQPTGEPDAPWARTPFGAAALGTVAGDVAMEAERFHLAESLVISNARMDIRLDPQRFDLKLNSGDLEGGRASGNLTVHNVGGNARVAGAFSVKGAALDAFVWSRDDRAIASGDLSFNTNFEATGRSPAGLMTSLTGGGVIEVSDGVARYINPNAARPLIRESDVGQAFTEDSLRAALEGTLDAGALEFGDATGSFIIAGGALRTKNLTLKGATVEARGEAVLDFNTMQTRADWTISLDPGDRVVEGTKPEIGLVFTGPIAAPVRWIDVLPFDSYLNMRLEARMLERIELEEAERLESARLRRLVRKFKQDGERRQRVAERATVDATAAGETADQLALNAGEARIVASEAAIRLETATRLRQAEESDVEAARGDVERLSGLRNLDAGKRAEAQAVHDAAAAERTLAVEARDNASQAAGAAADRQRETAADRAAAIAEAEARRDANGVAVAMTGEASASLDVAGSAQREAETRLAAASSTTGAADSALREARGAVAAADSRAVALSGVVEMAEGTLQEAENSAEGAAGQAGIDRSRHDGAVSAAEASLQALQDAQRDAADAAARVDAVVAIGAQLTSSPSATDVDRLAVESLEASARRQAGSAADAATEAEAAHDRDLAVLERASAAALTSDRAAQAADQANRDSVAALAVAQNAARAANDTLGAAVHLLAERTAARDTAAAALETARIAASESEQQRNAAQALLNLRLSEQARAAADLQVADIGRDEAGAAADQAARSATEAADLATLATSEADAAEVAQATASDQLQGAAAALQSAVATVGDAQATLQAAQSALRVRVEEYAAAESAWQHLDAAAATAEAAAATARATADRLADVAEQARIAASRIGGGEADIVAFLETQTTPPVVVQEPVTEEEAVPVTEEEEAAVTEAPTSSADSQETAATDTEQVEEAAEDVLPTPKLRPRQRPAQPLLISP